MAGYKVVKLLAVEPSELAQKAGVEARFARDPMGSRDLGISHFRYPPGHQASLGHRHKEQEEAYLVIGGSGRMLLDGDTVELEEWDLIRVAPETVRAFSAGPDGLEVIAVGGPKPEGGDGVRADISWPE